MLGGDRALSLIYDSVLHGTHYEDGVLLFDSSLAVALVSVFVISSLMISIYVCAF